MEIIQIVLSAIIGLGVSIGVIKKWKKLNWIQKSTAIIGIGLTIITAWNGIIELNKKIFLEKINSSFGDINDLDGATIPKMGLGMSDSCAIFDLDYVGVFNFKGVNDFFKLYVKNNKIFINVIVYDSIGNPVLAIFENTWTVYKNDFEYNYDDHAIELVTNGERKVFFHIELRKGIAHIEGSLFIPKNAPDRAIGIKGINIYEGKHWSGISYLHGIGNENDSTKALFKYPREKYFAIRVKY
jgi:hypothetical protein